LVNVRQPQAPTRFSVVVIGFLLCAFCTAEYWMLGPLSALGGQDELYFCVPWLYFLTHVMQPGVYAHAYAGGIDALTVADGTQYISLHRLLFAVLPLWLAILTVKAGAIAAGYAGGYRVARTGFGLTRDKAVVAAVIAGVCQIYSFVSPLT